MSDYPLLRVTVDRSKWYRGKGSAGSCLLIGDTTPNSIVSNNATKADAWHRENDGKMCCLGFMARAAGIPAEYITSIPTPSSISHALPARNALVGRFAYSGVSESNMTGCNDTINKPDAQREADIIAYGRKMNVEFKFVDGGDAPTKKPVK